MADLDSEFPGGTRKHIRNGRVYATFDAIANALEISGVGRDETLSVLLRALWRKRFGEAVFLLRGRLIESVTIDMLVLIFRGGGITDDFLPDDKRMPSGVNSAREITAAYLSKLPLAAYSKAFHPMIESLVIDSRSYAKARDTLLALARPDGFRQPSGRLNLQVKAIMEIADKKFRGLGKSPFPWVLPRSGKKALQKYCKEARPELFTDASFQTAWREASNAQNLIKSEIGERSKPRRAKASRTD